MQDERGRLVERGDTEWGVPVRELFPDLAEEVDIGWSAPTIDEVLICRSGMKANLARAEMDDAYDDPAPLTEQRSRTVVSALSSPPRSRGTFRYSNLGYIVAGAAIDRIAGMPYEEALVVELFGPLGISSAGYGPPPDVWGHKAKVQLGVALHLGTVVPIFPIQCIRKPAGIENVVHRSGGRTKPRPRAVLAGQEGTGSTRTRNKVGPANPRLTTPLVSTDEGGIVRILHILHTMAGNTPAVRVIGFIYAATRCNVLYM